MRSKTIRQVLETEGTFCRFLAVDVPYHSPVMDSLREELLHSLVGLCPRKPQVPLYSTVTGLAVNGVPLDAPYWWRNVRESVRFDRAVAALLQAEHATWLELGPHPALSASISTCAAQTGSEVTVLASLRRKEDESATMLSALGRLYALGHAIRWEALSVPGRRLLPLPKYPWQRERCWLESEESQRVRLGTADSGTSGLLGPRVHPLLGRLVESARSDLTWHAEFDLQKDHAWLTDHCFQGTPICPAAVYAELALAAGNQVFGSSRFEPEMIEIHKGMFASIDQPRKVQFLFDRMSYAFEICSREADGSWTRHATGVLRPRKAQGEPAPVDRQRLLARCWQTASSDQHYDFARFLGLELIRHFQGIRQLWFGTNEAVGRVEIPEGFDSNPADYIMHPAILDACFQVFASTVVDDWRERGLYLPRRIDRILFHRPWELEQGRAEKDPRSGVMWSFDRTRAAR